MTTVTLTRDEMLDNITLYWLTDTRASSARMYFEHAGVVGQNNSGLTLFTKLELWANDNPSGSS